MQAFLSVFSICLGASAGALLRWGAGLALNAFHPAIPLGTLAVNLIGGYLIGLASAIFTHYPAIGPEIRLLVVTGFLGGLTTFSTFSAEVMALLRQGNLLWALSVVLLHVGGALLMTYLGMMSFQAVR